MIFKRPQHHEEEERDEKMIAALQISVDGLIEGPNGELDWAMAEDLETWQDVFEMLSHVDTLILGRGMYSDYERYSASSLTWNV
jgi:dihydrofolate reductase